MRVIIHAGMPKTGSSSLQTWLEEESGGVLADHDVAVAVARRDDEGLHVERHVSGGVKSGTAANDLNTSGARHSAALLDGLAKLAQLHRCVVITAEGFSQLFWQGNRRFLTELNLLASSADVRVAYYARPQHTALEAAWRQWGFRSGRIPSEYVRRRARQLHYAETERLVRSIAPAVKFTLRPFRPDLLVGGNVVTDFASGFLGLDEIESASWTNKGLPLEVANLLSHAPAGMFWGEVGDNRLFGPIKRLALSAELEPDPRLERSRRALQGFAWDLFHVGNQEIGWPEFVPRPEGETPGVEILDELWKAQATPNELSFLFRVLRAAIE